MNTRRVIVLSSLVCLALLAALLFGWRNADRKPSAYASASASIPIGNEGLAADGRADASPDQNSIPSHSAGHVGTTANTSPLPTAPFLPADQPGETAPPTPIGRILRDATPVAGPVPGPGGIVRVVRSEGLKYPLLRIVESTSNDSGPTETIVMAADHLVVKNQSGLNEREFAARIQAMGYLLRKKMLAPDTYLVAFESKPEALPARFDDAIHELATLGRAEPDYLVQTQTVPNDPYLDQLWGLHNQTSLVTIGTNSYEEGGKMTYAPAPPEAGIVAPLVVAGRGQPGEFPPTAAGAIVLIERGDLTFAQKMTNAKAAGALGVLLYNNVEGDYSGTLQNFGDWLPVVPMSRADGLALLAQAGATATLSSFPNGRDISARQAWETQTGSPNVLVGVIDTGIDYNHPDLVANMWVNPGETGIDANGNDKATNGIDDDGNGFIDDVHGWDFANDDNNPMDDNRHGTHCAGTIAGVGNDAAGIVGVAWSARLAAIKFLSASGSGFLSDGVDSVYYGTIIGADLTSNSWGGGSPMQTMIDAIEDANANGVLFVAAAGNSSSGQAMFPAGYPNENILSVAASDSTDLLAGFSNYGLPHTDLAAPGVGIFSSVPTAIKTPPYEFLNGTSMACPHVSGVVVLLKSQVPGMTHLEIRQRILDTVDPVSALIGAVATGGRLNAHAALDGLLPGPQLAFESFEIDDSIGGNGDGVINPGETIQLFFTLENNGFEAAQDVVATFQTADGYTTIDSATTSFPLVPKKGQATAATPVEISISASAPTPHLVSATLALLDSEGRPTLVPITIPVSISYRVAGVVTVDGAPREGASLDFSGPMSGTVSTDPDGAFEFFVSNGQFSLEAYIANAPFSRTNAVAFSTPGDATGLDFSLTTATISGTVIDKATGSPVPDATVTLEGPLTETLLTATGGLFSTTHIYGRETGWTISAEKPGAYPFASSPASVTVPPDATGISLRLGAPTATIDTPSFEIDLPTGSSTTRTISLSNTGAGDLLWSFSGIVNPSGTPGQLFKQFVFPTALNLYPEGVAHDGQFLYAYDGTNSPTTGTLYKIDPDANPVANPTGVVETFYIPDIIPGFRANEAWLGCHDGDFLWFQVRVPIQGNSSRTLVALQAIDLENAVIARSVSIDPRLFNQTGGSSLDFGSAQLEAFGDNAFWFRTGRVNPDDGRRVFFITKVDALSGEILLEFPMPTELVAPNTQNLQPQTRGIEFSGGALWLVQSHHSNVPISQQSVFKKVFKIDAQTGAVLGTVNSPERQNLGIVADRTGALWIWSYFISPGTIRYLSKIDSGERIWLSANQVIGKVAEDTSAEIEFTFDTSFLTAGIHHGALRIATSDPAKPVVVIPVILNVGNPVPGNTAPSISSASPDSPVEIRESDTETFTIAASDPDSNPLTYVWSLDGKVVKGVTGNTWNYQPGFSDTGLHGVAVSVSDGRGGVASHVWQVLVANANRPPVASDASLSVANHETLAFTLEASDPDGEALAWHLLSQPSSGTLTGTAPDLLYTPAPGFLGTVNFQFKVDDGEDDSNTATVSIFVGNRVAVVAADQLAASVPFGQTATRTFTIRNDGSLPLQWASPMVPRRLPSNAGQTLATIGPIAQIYSFVQKGLAFDGTHILWGSHKLGELNQHQYSGMAKLDPVTGIQIGSTFPAATSQDYFGRYHYINTMAYDQGSIWVTNTSTISAGASSNFLSQYAIDEAANRLVALSRVPVTNGDVPEWPTGTAFGMESLWVVGPVVSGAGIDPEWSGIYRIEPGTKNRLARFPSPAGWDYGGPATFWNGAIWLAHTLTGDLQKINPFTGATLQTIDLAETIKCQDMAPDRAGGFFLKWNNTQLEEFRIYQVDGGEYLRMSPDSGTVLPGETATVTVTFDPARVGAGSHQADILVLTNDPNAPSTPISVSFDVTSTGVGEPPVITSFSPATAVEADARQRITFSISVEDPDGDPLTINWRVDGVAQRRHANRTTFDFHAPDTGGAQSVEVSVSDDNGNLVSQIWEVVSSPMALATQPVATPSSGPAPLNVAFQSILDGGLGQDGSYRAEAASAIVEAEEYHRFNDYEADRDSAAIYTSTTPLNDSFDNYIFVWAPNQTTPAEWQHRAELEYDIQFPAAGSYHLWMRVRSKTNNSNSIWVGMDGTQVGGVFDDVPDQPHNTWRWVRHSAAFAVSAGLHTFNLRAREHDYLVDRILFTTDSAFTPTGLGPLWQSPRLPALSYTWAFGDGTPDDATPTPAHTYTSPGEYLASLLIDDGVATAQGSVTIRAETSYAQWVAEHLSGLPADQRDPLDIPSGSRYPNLLRYALGITDIDDSGDGAVETVTTTDGDKTYLSLRYRRDPLAGGVELRVEVSGNLADWDWNDGSTTATIIEEIVPNPDATQTILVRDTVPIEEAPRRFIRIHVRIP